MMSALEDSRIAASAPTSSSILSSAFSGIFLSPFHARISARTALRTSPAASASSSIRMGSGQDVRWMLLHPSVALKQVW